MIGERSLHRADDRGQSPAQLALGRRLHAPDRCVSQWMTGRVIADAALLPARDSGASATSKPVSANCLPVAWARPR